MKAEESRDNDRFRLAPNGVPWERYFPWWSKREEARKLPRADRLQYLIDFLEEQPRREDLSISHFGSYLMSTGKDMFHMGHWCRLGVFTFKTRWVFGKPSPPVLKREFEDSPHVCGTSGCAAGWTVMLFGDFSPMELYWRAEMATPGWEWQREAANLLGVVSEYGDRIFVKESEKGEDYALRSLKHLRDHKVPLHDRPRKE